MQTKELYTTEIEKFIRAVPQSIEEQDSKKDQTNTTPSGKEVSKEETTVAEVLKEGVSTELSPPQRANSKFTS